MCRSIRVVRKLQAGPSPRAQPLSTHARTHAHTSALWHRPLITNPSVTDDHNLYSGPRWLLWDAAPHFIFHHILFHLISSNSNPLNPNVRRRRAPLFGQVKWLQAMMCFPAQSAAVQHTSAAAASPRAGLVCVFCVDALHPRDPPQHLLSG